MSFIKENMLKNLHKFVSKCNNNNKIIIVILSHVLVKCCRHNYIIKGRKTSTNLKKKVIPFNITDTRKTTKNMPTTVYCSLLHCVL